MGLHRTCWSINSRSARSLHYARVIVFVGCTPAPKNHHVFFCSKTMSLVENINRFCSFLGMVQSQKCSSQSCNKIIWGLRIESPTCYFHDFFVNKMGCQLHFCWVFQRVESRHGVSSDLVFQARLGPVAEIALGSQKHFNQKLHPD